jgi:hypothetical protein
MSVVSVMETLRSDAIRSTTCYQVVSFDEAICKGKDVGHKIPTPTKGHPDEGVSVVSVMEILRSGAIRSTIIQVVSFDEAFCKGKDFGHKIPTPTIPAL